MQLQSHRTGDSGAIDWMLYRSKRCSGELIFVNGGSNDFS